MFCFHMLLIIFNTCGVVGICYPLELATASLSCYFILVIYIHTQFDVHRSKNAELWQLLPKSTSVCGWYTSDYTVQLS